MRRLALRFVPRARVQADEAERWWRSNRAAAPDLFASELDELLERVRLLPAAGSRYRNAALPDLRRCLMRQTGFHVYYVVRDEDLVVVAIWSGRRGHGPPLSPVH